jgi:hypothetical protein
MPETVPASFFVVGGTLRRDALSYIERAADEKLYQALTAGDFCYVLTARQMGKSSLMVRTAARLRMDGLRVAVLDLTSLGQNLTAEQWYNGVLERIGQQLSFEDELEKSWQRSAHLGPMRRFMRAFSDVILPSTDRKIVVFVDEIDAVRSLPFSTDEFFAGIRECYNRRSSDPAMERLTFCLLGVATPSDLVRDTRTTPFNIGRRIELTDFEKQEATPLAQGLGVADGHELTVLDRVIYWTGGHPYLTQRLCQKVAQSAAVRNPSDVDLLCEELFLSNRARERDDNLLFVRERMLKSEVDVSGLLTLYDKVRRGNAVRDDETNPLISILRLSGITRVENGLLKVRNRVYNKVFDHEWVLANLPGAEVRRQRVAYKAGLKKALAITVPLLVLGIIVAFGKVYLIRSTLILPEFKTPVPPAFWASSRVPESRGSTQIGGVLLRTGEPDVTVLVNDFQYSRTTHSGDLRIPLPPASYEIRLEKPGFQALKLPSVNVLKDQETQISVRLQRAVIAATSILITASVPGATVRFDGKDLGQVESDGTMTRDITPGSHTVEIEKNGYITLRSEQKFALGKTLVIDGRLEQDAESMAYSQDATSTDASVLRQFLRKYPNGRYAPQVLSRLEDIEWNNLNKSDLTALDMFLRTHSQGRHASEARRLVDDLQREQSEFIDAMGVNSTGALRAFLNRHPDGPYADRVRTNLALHLDKEAVLGVLHSYEDSYNRHDFGGILQVWPSCPEKYRKLLRDSFQSLQPQSLKLEVRGEPEINGNFATVKCQETRSGALNATAPVTITLVRDGDKWVIQSGIF